MAVVTGAGAAGFAKVDPKLLAQKEFVDPAATIKAVGEGISKTLGEVEKLQEEREQQERDNELELNNIVEDERSETKRLKEWTDNGNLPEDFESKIGYARKDNQVVFENQIKRMALGLTGRDSRRYNRSKRRLKRGKEALSGRTGDVTFNDDGKEVDSDGKVLLSTQEDSGKDRTYSDYEQQIFKQFPDLNPEHSRKLPNKKAIGQYAADTDNSAVVIDVMANTIDDKRLGAINNPQLAGFMQAHKQGRLQRMYNGTTESWDYVWTDSSGKINKKPVELVHQNQVKAFGAPQEDVTVNTVAKGVNVSFKENVFLDENFRANLKSNIQEYFGNQGDKAAYINQYGIDVIDLDGDDDVTPEELYHHWETVYAGINPNFRDSLNNKGSSSFNAANTLLDYNDDINTEYKAGNDIFFKKLGLKNARFENGVLVHDVTKSDGKGGTTTSAVEVQNTPTNRHDITRQLILGNYGSGKERTALLNEFSNVTVEIEKEEKRILDEAKAEFEAEQKATLVKTQRQIVGYSVQQLKTQIDAVIGGTSELDTASLKGIAGITAVEKDTVGDEFTVHLEGGKTLRVNPDDDDDVEALHKLLSSHKFEKTETPVIPEKQPGFEDLNF